MRPKRDPIGAGQESVWDYPRPPRVERTTRRLVVVAGGVTVAETTSGYRVLETSHPPVYYFPRSDVNMSLLRPASGTNVCEWKGQAQYFDLVVPGSIRPRAAWSYVDPLPGSEAIREYIAFYPAAADRCTVDGTTVTPQPGGFYGGWITPDIVRSVQRGTRHGWLVTVL